MARQRNFIWQSFVGDFATSQRLILPNGMLSEPSRSPLGHFAPRKKKEPVELEDLGTGTGLSDGRCLGSVRLTVSPRLLDPLQPRHFH